MRSLCVLALWVCAASVSAGPTQSRQDDDAARISQVFAERVQAYVKLQKDLDDTLPAPSSKTDVDQITARQRELAVRIAAARRDSRRGDIFTPEVTGRFHAIIRKAFREPDARKIRRTIEEGDPAQATVLHVNAVHSEEIPLTTMPPILLRRLPALPMDLAYRIIGRALVLKDVKTNVIVDFIPDAIPRIR